MRPPLRRIPLAEVLPLGSRAGLMATMSPGQWDSLLAALYEGGDVLVEVNVHGTPIAAYQKDHAEKGRAS